MEWTHIDGSINGTQLINGIVNNTNRFDDAKVTRIVGGANQKPMKQRF